MTYNHVYNRQFYRRLYWWWNEKSNFFSFSRWKCSFPLRLMEQLLDTRIAKRLISCCSFFCPLYGASIPIPDSGLLFGFLYRRDAVAMYNGTCSPFYCKKINEHMILYQYFLVSSRVRLPGCPKIYSSNGCLDMDVIIEPNGSRREITIGQH